MNYLYHGVPKNLKGSILYPLNILKNLHPEIYESEVGKYRERAHIMEQRIPFLDCLWNDVLHFTAINPTLIREALVAAGQQKMHDLTFFEIDPHLLDSSKTTVYLNNKSKITGEFGEESFVTYDPDSMEQYSHLSNETREYYKEMYTHDKSPLLFHRVPHILFRGSLDISDIKQISW
jgi:hypothetical protein